MADISVIKLPSGSNYNIKDAWAREQLAGIVGGDALVFIGVTTTPLTDGSTTSPVSINNTNVTPQKGNVVFYTPTGEPTQEYIWNGSSWQMFGAAADILGDLAYKDTASGTITPTGTITKPTFTGSSSSVSLTFTDNTNGNYQPAGTVTKPNFTGTAATINSSATYTPAGGISLSKTDKTTTVSAAASGTTTYTPGGSVGTPTISLKTAGSTETIHNPTSKTVVTDMSVSGPNSTQANGELIYCAVDGQTLSLQKIVETRGASITTSDISVKTGDAAYQSSQPSWSGTAVRLVTGKISTADSASFTGTQATINSSASYTPAGGVSQPTFTGTKVQVTGSTTAAGSVSQPTFTGDIKTVTVS